MIDKEEFEKANFEEKQKFIKKILKLATHNSFTKDDLLFLIKWQNTTIEKMVCCGNCKHPAKDSTGCCCPFAASCHNKSLWEMDAN